MLAHRPGSAPAAVSGRLLDDAGDADGSTTEREIRRWGGDEFYWPPREAHRVGQRILLPGPEPSGPNVKTEKELQLTTVLPPPNTGAYIRSASEYRDLSISCWADKRGDETLR